MAVASADLAHHHLGAVHAPVDRTHVLAHQWPGLCGLGLALLPGLGPLAAGGDHADGLEQCVERGAADLVPVDAALARLAHRESAGRPHRSRIEYAVGLEHGYSPLAHGQLDRPVQRRWTAVTDRPRMHDQAAVPRPHRLWDQPLQERTHDQVGRLNVDGGLHLGGPVDDRDPDLVPELGEGDLGSLAQAVVRGDQEQDPQRAQSRVQRCHRTPCSLGISPSCSSISRRSSIMLIETFLPSRWRVTRT